MPISSNNFNDTSPEFLKILLEIYEKRRLSTLFSDNCDNTNDSDTDSNRDVNDDGESFSKFFFKIFV